MSDGETESIVEIESTARNNLHRWQKEAIQYFFENGKAIFNVVTGAGKTYAALVIIEEVFRQNPNARALIVVPKNVILEDTWYREIIDFGWTIRDVGFHYGSMKEPARIVLTNIQSVGTLPLEPFKDGILVCDEVHHNVGISTKEMMNFPFKHMLGLSATVERLDNKHWNILEKFAWNIYRYSPEEALRDGVLNEFYFFDYVIELDPVARDEYDRLTAQLRAAAESVGGIRQAMRLPDGDPRKVAVLSKMNERKKMVCNYPGKFAVVKKICRQHFGEKTLIFNEYNSQTTKTHYELLDVGIRSGVNHSGMDKTRRERTLKDFRDGKLDIICTTKVLDEGYDVRGISLGILMAGNSSAQQAIQRFGRCLRKKQEPSRIIQIFCALTFEERHAEKRTAVFRKLCKDYERVMA